jgi:recombination protein RecA
LIRKRLLMAKKKNELNELLDKLRKSHGASVADVMEAGRVKRFILSSPKLNYIFGGGFPIARIIEMFGPESGGKTVLASSIAGQIQRREDGYPSKVIYVDMEHTFDINYAQVVGLDPDPEKFVFIHPRHGEEGFTICEELIQTGEFGLIVWDSIAATPSSSVIEDEFGKASFGKTALLFSEALKKFNPNLSRYNTSMILLNQLRADIGGYNPHGPAEKTAGGYAPKFYASWRGRVARKENIMDSTTVIGNTITVKNVKSKIGFPKRSAELELYYATGFNPDLEYVDFIVNLGLVDKAGSWYSFEGDKIGQGRTELVKWLYEHREIFEEFKDTVNESFSQHTILDEAEQEDEEAEKEAEALGE